MAEISVIVPVYNGEQYLESCVDSVRRQTFPDWELLLVDDGSTDGTPALCQSFAAADNRVRYLRQPQNAGVSEARNRGLREARGAWIAFLDADDRFVPETLETLRNLCAANRADTAGCAHWNVTVDGGEDVETLLPAGVYDRSGIREKVVLPLFGERLKAPLFNGFIWRYLFTAELVRGISFAGAYLEDELFLLDYFLKAERLAVTEEPLYRYLCNPQSATRKFMKNLPSTLETYMERKEELAVSYDLEGDCPLWRENSRWANLLILVANEYAHGNPKTMGQRRAAVEALCRAPGTAEAIDRLKPEGLGRNKQMVADLLRRRHYRLLALLYRLKNRL